MTPPPHPSAVDAGFDVPSRKGQFIMQPPGGGGHASRRVRADIGSERVVVGTVEVVPPASTAANDGRSPNSPTADDRWPPHWPVVAASAIAGAAVAAGVVLTTFAALDEGVNVYIALAVLIGGLGLLATLITALGDNS